MKLEIYICLLYHRILRSYSRSPPQL